jgi:deoxyribonuclease V
MNRWDVPVAEAIRIQQEMRSQVKMIGDGAGIANVAGVDVGFRDGEMMAAVAVLGYPSLDLLEVATARRPAIFPYVPGLLSFRELPAVLEAWERLRTAPNLVMVDGHGYAHPRRFGIACHLGVVLDLPTIGCAKSRLCGVADALGAERGSVAAIRDKNETIGALVRTKTGISPVYVSIGHRIDLDAAVGYVLACANCYRLPEPTRLAHRAASGGR